MRAKGSSPLTRGKPSLSSARVRAKRLIPAHAGKTTRCTGPRARGSAHPRSRGENERRRSFLLRLTGSSPLTRGKPQVDRADARRPGLIPAHAGKTAIVGRPDVLMRGSSPLTRGKHPPQLPRFACGGLIPAHAGKTGGHSDVDVALRAHPRSRGENRKPRRIILMIHGSSPLTRGKHFLTCAFIAQIDQILESLELCAFSESYSSQDVYATDAPRDRVRSIGLAPRSSRGAS